ncbi:hypothetical protein KIN20_016784 [Parelaphostrongylus tenuis]|uniref:Hemimethylated DNA-binding domain-containing protein n=1 Tax=Parelaphostrongylus tenuis TaxID=148309 RepID=A0AAD5N2A9_PARTN|nr:hypothetical protein KIN20_016784 [Parelaphostrongylus tenuis]
MDLHPGLVFVVLVVLVPLQYYLSPSSSSDMKYYIQRLTDSIIAFTEQFGFHLPFVSIRKNKGIPVFEDDAVDESERSEAASYGSSLQVRERSPNVRWRIGQVIKHKALGYRGVIIGWDLKAKASAKFIEKVHKGNKEWTNNPNYAVLIDARDRMVPQMGYIAQDNIELHKGRIIHTLLSNYMEKYDEEAQKYVPKPWLRAVYPDD